MRFPKSLSSTLPLSRSLSTTVVRAAPPALARTPEAETPNQAKTAAQWADFGRSHVSHGLGRLRDHVIVKGQGLELFTAEGKRLLDFTAGIGVTNLGQ
jgi:4-aminobutyrate aminotransferase